MNGNRGKTGFSLTELLVVISVILLLVGIGVPAFREIMQSFESSGGVKSLINATLANARAMAVKKQAYVGVRFQKAYDPDIPGNPLKWPQYMTFIIHDPAIGAYGFRAVEGRRPLKLPAGVGVMDMKIVDRVFVSASSITLTDVPINADGLIDEPFELADTTTFSVVFSPAGVLWAER